MRKISLKGLLAGTLTHYLLGYLFLIIPIVYVLLPLQTQEIGFTQLGQIFLDAIEGSAKLPALQTLAKLASALFAGYAAARLAGRHELLNGSLAVLPLGAWEAYRLMTGAQTPTSGMEILLIAATFACALFGGFLATFRNRAKPGSQKS